MKVYVSVYLNDKLVKEIDKKAKKEDRSRNYTINKILEDYIY